jgi:hypothetical protein
MAKTKPAETPVVADVIAAPAVAFFDGPMQGRTEMPADAQANGNEVLLRLPTVALVYTLLSDVGGVKTYRLARTEPRRG